MEMNWKADLPADMGINAIMIMPSRFEYFAEPGSLSDLIRARRIK